VLIAHTSYDFSAVLPVWLVWGMGSHKHSHKHTHTQIGHVLFQYIQIVLQVDGNR
jgi:hypothetical protein